MLVDKNETRSRAEANDIYHAVPFARPLKVTARNYAYLKGSRAVIIAAGVNQKPGESRLQLLQRNAAVFRDVLPEVLANAPDAVLVIATNPVDVMTHLAASFIWSAGQALWQPFRRFLTMRTKSHSTSAPEWSVRQLKSWICPLIPEVVRHIWQLC